MLHCNLVAFLALAVVSATAFDVRRVATQRTVVQNLQLPKASFVANLTQKAPRSAHKQELLKQLRGPSAKTATAAGSDDNEEYLTGITIGGQDFQVIIDTGSSDTWLAKEGFACFDLQNNSVPTSQCAFGTAGFDTSKSKTFTPLPDTNFNITYGDGEFLSGDVGFDTVTVGGLTVTHQEIGIVTKAAWNGDGINTGLIGLAYPGITSVFNGTDPHADNSSNNALYNPFFFSAVQEKVVAAPYFSVSLDRGSFAARSNSSYDPNLGFLAFGGIAPVPVTSTAVTVPVQGYSVKSGGSEFFFYNVDVDSYVFTGSGKVTTKGAAILDTGTTLNYVPTEVAKAFNAQFKPPAKFVEDEDTYYVDCDATAPSFAATIGGKQFVVDGRDNIVPSVDENGKLTCISGTQDGGEDTDGNIFILGDVFLHNVVATFDISDNTITLHERTKY